MSLHAVVYTGTHDNNTLIGWWTQDCSAAAQQHARRYLGHPADAPEALQREVLASVARLAVLPMQDLLELGAEARMNRPGTAVDNWSWRLDWIPDDAGTSQRYRSLNRLYGRLVAG